MKAFNLKTALQYPQKTHELYIHGLKLKKFPKEILDLKLLKKLELTSHQLKCIPDEICQLEFLEELVLNDNQLTHLPTSLKNLKHLKTIQLNDNNFTEFPRVLLDCLSLESIELKANALQDIPATISQLRQIRKLNFDYNKLKELPETLFRLCQLIFLSFSNNGIKKIPSEIGNCVELKNLIANQNLIKTLPATIAKLSQLRLLDLSGNKFKEFPKAILACSALEKLSFRKCNLKRIPTEIYQLSFLNQLELSFNKLIELPDTITKLRFLRELFLASNKLSALPIQIFKLDNLRKLDVSKNPLTTLPLQLDKLEQLESLVITGNWNLKTKTKNSFIQAPLYGSRYLYEKYKANSQDTEVQVIFYFLEQLIYFKQLIKLSISTRYLATRQVKVLLNFIKTSRLQGLPDDLRLPFFQLLLSHESAKFLDRGILLKALSFKQINVRTTALKILQNQNTLQEALHVDSHLVFLGKSVVNKKWIKTRLRKTGMKIYENFSSHCTHVVLGNFPDLSKLKREDSFVILQAHQIMAYLTKAENNFLLSEENDRLFQNLSSLLWSNQAESVALALQMLKTIGLPSKLYTDLLIAFKESNHAKHKKTIRALLALYLDSVSDQLVRELDWNKFKNKKYTKKILEEKLKNTVFETNRLWNYLQSKRP